MKRFFLLSLVLLLVGVGIYFLLTALAGSEKQGNYAVANNESDSMQPQESYSLHLLSQTNNIESIQPTTIKFTILNASGNIVKNFGSEHDEIMHFLVVRQDLQDFQHIHPKFDKESGQFTVETTFALNGNYQLFADFTPKTGQEDSNFGVVTTVSLNIGDAGEFLPIKPIPSTDNVKNIEGYTVTYNLPTKVKSLVSVPLSIIIEKDNQPVNDLELIYGSLAQGIIFDVSNLRFEHLHTEEIGSYKKSDTGAPIIYYYSFPKAGIYKVFIQFKHQGKIITTDHTLLAE